ncbi:MAG: cupredoxin domain-containing protein [Smithellaceae bacterium]|nr:cupredoxin domain-containing protein [Smithellaceae bacterium]
MKIPNGALLFACAVVLLASSVVDLGGGGISLGQEEQVIKVVAKRFEYSPNTITVKIGVPVDLEFTSLDRLHGFNCPGLSIRTDIYPGKVNRLQFVPQKKGTFPFHCDNFCGSGHEGMTGTLLVTD